MTLFDGSRRFAFALGVAALVVPAVAWAADCANTANVLGVSRVVEIDTSGGPRYGEQQYKDDGLLKRGEIVLTFDDGPIRSHTQPILNALDAQCTKATFFMVGSQAIADPDMVKRVLAHGHTVGSHSWSHADFQKGTPLKARQEIELGLSAVTAAAGQPVAPFFRFPYLAQTKAMLGYTQTRNLGVFSIDVDSRDWKTKNAASVQRDVLSQLAEQGKGIILMHDIQPATAQALPALLEALRVKGYKVVQLKPKVMATTLPEFDAVARDAKTRNQVAVTSQPLARRAMTWGSGSTAALGQPSAEVSVRRAPPPVGPFTGETGTPGTSTAGASLAAATAQAAVNRQPIRDPQVQPPAPVADWRDKIFNR